MHFTTLYAQQVSPSVCLVQETHYATFRHIFSHNLKTDDIIDILNSGSEKREYSIEATVDMSSTGKVPKDISF